MGHFCVFGETVNEAFRTATQIQQEIQSDS
jgi:hypothetical protein